MLRAFVAGLCCEGFGAGPALEGVLYSPTIMAEYFGTYADFQTASKKDAGALLGADNSVGDVCQLAVVQKDGETRAWLENRFGARVGYLDADVSRTVRTLQAEGLETKAVLSFVAFTDHPGDGHYWGQVALICYKPADAEAFDAFVQTVAQRMGQGLRTNVDLGAEGAAKVAESGGTWVPSQTVPLPENGKGTAYLKVRRKITERVIDQGRAGNKGCYVISWAFLLALVALLMFGLHSCGVF